MVRVGLIGAPGAGKTTLAVRLADALEYWFIDESEELAEDLEEVPVGVVGDYYSNLLVAFARRIRELKHSKEPGVVSCGTLVDSLVHAGLYAETLGSGLRTPQSEQRLLREMHGATLLSFMLVDLLPNQYDQLFYLPLGEQLILPGLDSQREKTFAQRLDLGLREVIMRFNIDAVELTGTAVEKFEQAKKVLEEANVEADVSN